MRDYESLGDELFIEAINKVQNIEWGYRLIISATTIIAEYEFEENIVNQVAVFGEMPIWILNSSKELCPDIVIHYLNHVMTSTEIEIIGVQTESDFIEKISFSYGGGDKTLENCVAPDCGCKGYGEISGLSGTTRPNFSIMWKRWRTTLSVEFKVDFTKALLGLRKTFADESPAEHAREILTLRKEKPSEAVPLSTELAKRKEGFDAAFEANEPVDADEMDRFLFYFEAAQKEIGVAEPAIELVPPNWASQVAERFQMPQSEAGTPTDRRAREARVNEHYAELQQSFGPRADDVIAYSLTRAASTSVQPLGLRPSHL